MTARGKESKDTTPALAEYAGKRDFGRTAEPPPLASPPRTGPARRRRQAAPQPELQFVVQKHAARRLHYDLRLEFQGTLKSWAVTRGPSLVAGEKRLAVRTEDHPLQYLEFEGNIPQGEYGGGAMIVWDRGTWSCAFDPAYGLDKGHLEFTLSGQRLNGRWHLVRMRPRAREKKEQWLLIKADDAHARHAGEPAITDEATSALSGLTTEQLGAAGDLRADHAGRVKVGALRATAPPDPRQVSGARKGLLPAFLDPSLPQSVARAPSGSNWVHEIKYDGYRIQARLDGGHVALLTRKGLDWTSRMSSIASALRSLALSSGLLDGEVVVEDDSGIPSFSLLQQELKRGRGDRLRYFVFDLLYCEGFDLTRAVLADRKILLRQIVQSLPPTLPIRFSDHLKTDGPTMFEHACRLGLEGIVSKRIDLPYRPGRGEHWLKVKSVRRDEFIIIGYVPSKAALGSVGALLLGYFDGAGRLCYAGRVGTGYSTEEARSLRVELDRIAGSRPEMANPLPAGSEKEARWVRPRLVCEVEYQGWTADKLIRQSSFVALREDRAAEEVRLEAAPAAGASSRGSAGRSQTAERGREGRRKLTHPERLLWPEQGVSKQGLADFYSDIADWILPHIRDRVLSLVRCPSGVSDTCFFAKHAWHGLSSAVHRIDVGEKEKMLALDGLDGLIDLVQAGVTEIHPWGSTVAAMECPDRLIFDLDPGEGVPWSAVVEGARVVRGLLQDFGLRSFVKTSGGKGLHVVVPLEPKAGWVEAKAFAQSVAEALAKGQPERYVAIMSKRARRGRIFIDYLRNGRGATAVAAYSTRALPQASVSTPLAWEELSDSIRADHFKIGNLRQRLAVLREAPWPDFFKLRQQLPAKP